MYLSHPLLLQQVLVSRFYRDMRLISIGGGTDEVMLGIICKYMGILPKLSKKWAAKWQVCPHLYNIRWLNWWYECLGVAHDHCDENTTRQCPWCNILQYAIKYSNILRYKSRYKYLRKSVKIFLSKMYKFTFLKWVFLYALVREMN